MTSMFMYMAAMVLLASLFVLVPFIRYKAGNKQAGVTSDWYQSRKAELERELAEGRFSPQQHQDAVAELQETAKQELKQALNKEANANSKSSKTILAVASVSLIAITIGFYSQKGHYQKLDDWQQTMFKMEELSQKIIQDSNDPVTAEDLKAFALGLRTKLIEKDEAIGWMLLGRTLMAMRDIDGAIAAFEKSYKREPQNISNALSYGQALQQSGDDILVEQSLQLFSEVLTKQPDNQLAAMLLGESSLMLERFEGAKTAFDYSLNLLAQDDPRRELVQQRLLVINQQLGLSQEQSGLTITVSLAPEIAGDLDKFKNLFVFARLNSMPMPIAVKKLPVTGFPLSINLSDADAMVPELKLSEQQVVEVYARLSVDEQAPWATGDWQGKASDVDVNNKEAIHITIAEENK